jgi:hypothetical protein
MGKFIIKIIYLIFLLSLSVPYTASAYTFTQFMQKGSSGSEIIELQQALKKDHLIYPEGIVSGYFGFLTEKAIQRFQAKYGVINYGTPASTGYGLVGKRTRVKLNEIFGKNNIGIFVPPTTSQSIVTPQPTPTSISPSPPISCEKDTWQCADWNTCSSQGMQLRNCTLSFDCPTATTLQPQTTQSCTSLAPSPDVQGYRTSTMGKFISTDIVVDTDSANPPDSELNEFFRVANNILVLRTDTELKLGKIRRVSYSSYPANCTGCVYGGTSNNIFYEIYKNEPEPEYIIFLRADNISSSYGGYATTLESIHSNFCNRYKSAQGYANRVYINVSDWSHKFGTCGYDYSDLKNPKHVSDVALGGECRNRPGTACVLKDNYYQCNDSEMLNSFYSRNKYAFMASNVVHELLHQFGSDGNYDHYGAGKCVVPNPADLNAAQEYAGICPPVFDIFKNSYHQC